MALIIRKGLLEFTSPLFQSKRFRGKINFKRPKPPHFERAAYFEVSKPYFINPNKAKSHLELCKSLEPPRRKTVEVNPFQQILAGELKRWFHESRLIAFYHRNPMSSDQELRAYNLFKKEKMHFKNYGKKTMEMAIKDTKFEPVLQLYVSQNMTVFSPEPNLKKLFSVSKKIPQLVLLAAIYDDYFINVDDLKKYNMIPNIETAQAQLVQTLNSLGGTIVQQLFTHQQNLISHLDQVAEQLKKDK